MSKTPGSLSGDDGGELGTGARRRRNEFSQVVSYPRELFISRRWKAGWWPRWRWVRDRGQRTWERPARPQGGTEMVEEWR